MAGVAEQQDVAVSLMVKEIAIDDRPFVDIGTRRQYLLDLATETLNAERTLTSPFADQDSIRNLAPADW